MKTFLSTVKKYATLMAFGALAGTALCLLVAPGALEWWATPDIPDAICQCEKHVALAVGRLVRIEVYGALVAAVLTAIGAAVLSRMSKSRAQRSAQGATPTDPGAAS